MSIPVCSGGTISVGATSIEFSNGTSSVCTLSSSMPGWPATDPQVPAKSGNSDGTLTVQLSARAASGDYEYTASCCGKRNNPVIHVQ